MTHKGFTVIDGGKSETPGVSHTRASEPAPGLPDGFRPGTHAARKGGIPCIDKDGNEGELIELAPGEMPPPELLLLMLLAASIRRN